MVEDWIEESTFKLCHEMNVISIGPDYDMTYKGQFILRQSKQKRNGRFTGLTKYNKLLFELLVSRATHCLDLLLFH